MNRRRKLIKILGGVVTALQEEMTDDEFYNKFPTIKEQMNVATTVTPWSPGNGWRIIMEVPFKITNDRGGFSEDESSENVILYALSTLIGKDELAKCLDEAYSDEVPADVSFLDEYAPFLGREITDNDFEVLMDDLTDINYHSLRNVIEEKY